MFRPMSLLFLQGFTILLLKGICALEFKDITSDVFKDGHYSGVTAAFGDFNGDKLTDLFCIQHAGKTLEILLSNTTEPHLGQASLTCSFQSVITDVVPGDFNGDSMMDVLIGLQEESSNIINIIFLWGSLDSIKCSGSISFNMSVQPLVLDYNDNMVLDIMGEDEEGKRCIWIYKDQNFTKEFIQSKDLQRLRIPHSSAVVDINNDFVSDLVITGREKLELWIKNGSKFSLKQFVDYPKGVVVYGQSTFVDFNTNGSLNHLMAVCHDSKCKSSLVVILDDSYKWETLLDNFTYQGSTWGFPNHERPGLEKAALPITLRSGDFNMDGYPDFIVVLENKSKEQTRAVILENVACSNCPFGRTLQINWEIRGLESLSDVQLVAFYDIFEDGSMDILATTKTSKSGNNWEVHALKSTDTYDAYFIKILVLSGLCSGKSSCGLGGNLPGPVIMYNTTKFDGETVVSCAVQMPQSAHFPLHLPYTVFGLGHTPNFVEVLTVAIPQMSDGRIHKRSWTQIIPNSQMVVIPIPPNDEKRWVNRLFLTPSHLVFMTCIALVGTCGFIALIIFILHWKERREDKKERMQEAYRFHFDAM